MKKIILLTMLLLVVLTYQVKAEDTDIRDVGEGVDIVVTDGNVTITAGDQSFIYNTTSNSTNWFNHTFPTEKRNCTNCLEAAQFISGTCLMRENVHDANKILSVNIESCDPDKNKKCAEQKDLYDNCSTSLTSIQTSSTTKNTELEAASNSLATCETDLNNSMPTNRVLLFGGIIGGVYFFVIKPKKFSKTKDSRRIDRRMVRSESEDWKEINRLAKERGSQV